MKAVVPSELLLFDSYSKPGKGDFVLANIPVINVVVREMSDKYFYFEGIKGKDNDYNQINSG